MYSNADGAKWSAEPGTNSALLDGFETESGGRARLDHDLCFDGFRSREGPCGGAWAGMDGVPEHLPQIRLQGDFYNEPDNVERGVTMVNPAMLGGMYHDAGAWCHDFELPLKGQCGEASEWMLGVDTHGSAGMQIQDEPQFSELMAPAQVSLRSCACTSVAFCSEVSGLSAAKVARSVYTFLTTQVQASISKVKQEKFSMKADVFDQSGGFLMHCLMKARVFATELPGQLVVEFRRCRGDAVAFGHIFHQAVSYLELQLGVVSTGSCQARHLGSVPPAPPPPTAGDSPRLGLEAPGVTPLVHMVANSADPLLQAEAVAALAAIAGANAAGATAIWAMMNSGMQEVLAGLCSTVPLDAAYPAALLASRLAQHHGNSMAESSLALAALKGAVAENTKSLVRSELAEVILNVAGHRCLGGSIKSTCGNGETLRDALAEALLKKPFAPVEGNHLTRLREALHMLGQA
mmetsp:Transcript_1978/g.3833  ORF Transcript_1978/g.3833 Transcript_1978/m.3833 type:complete len:463 (+) Transcript_1978:125-1513(+)